jgi:hypothetical protein
MLPTAVFFAAPPICHTGLDPASKAKRPITTHGVKVGE